MAFMVSGLSLIIILGTSLLSLFPGGIGGPFIFIVLMEMQVHLAAAGAGIYFSLIAEWSPGPQSLLTMDISWSNIFWNWEMWLHILYQGLWPMRQLKRIVVARYSHRNRDESSSERDSNRRRSEERRKQLAAARRRAAHAGRLMGKQMVDMVIFVLKPVYIVLVHIVAAMDRVSRESVRQGYLRVRVGRAEYADDGEDPLGLGITEDR
jgi:hypothetical protein